MTTHSCPDARPGGLGAGAPLGRAFRMAGAPCEDALALELLAAEGYGTEPLPGGVAFRAAPEPRPLGGALAARFGLIYIQDPSSMLPPLMLGPPPGAAVLDLCASPGGKSGLLARLVGPDGLVLANEPNASRLDTLRRNLERSGLLNYATCSHPGQDLPLAEASWSQILLDPPCSGWGTAHKHPRVMDMWQGAKTEPLIRLQQGLLAKAARLLAPGGRLLYSTCTTNPAENEDQVAWAARELGLAVLPLARPQGFALREPARPEAQGCVCVSPEPGASQGFFLALLTRPGCAGPGAAKPGHRAGHLAGLNLPGRPLSEAELAAAPLDWSAAPPGRAWRFNDKAVFLHERALALAGPDLRWQGAPLGRVKGGVLHPSPLLRALAPPLEQAPGLDLDDHADLIRLLSGQSLDYGGAEDFPVLRFQGRALGRLRRKGRRVVWTGR